MGRLHLSALGHKGPPETSVDHGTAYSTARIESERHVVFVPMHYERNYAYPLLVWLHGVGDDERQLLRVMPLVSMRNYVAVAPRAADRGRRWTQSEAGIAAAEHDVYAAIDDARSRFHIAPQRVYVAGYAEGGTMALRLALRNPGAFAGALTIGGPFPEGHLPLARLDGVRKLPLFIAQGRDSQHYPVDRTCRELKLFHAAGMNATLRVYPCGDELTAKMLHDMDVWIMDRVTGVES
jgi:phospholipase/carboxylesterase